MNTCILIRILRLFQWRKLLLHIFYRSASNCPYVNPTFFGLFWTFFAVLHFFFGRNILNLDDLGPKYVERPLTSLNQWNKMKKKRNRGQNFHCFLKISKFSFFQMFTFVHFSTGFLTLNTSFLRKNIFHMGSWKFHFLSRAENRFSIATSVVEINAMT